MAADEIAIEYDLLSPEVLADPYPLYHRLRAEAPVHWNELLGGWVLTRYADVVAALHDARLSSSRAATYTSRVSEAGSEGVGRLMSAMMLMADPPDHTRLRGLANRAFTTRAVEAMRPRVQEVVDGLLDGVQDAGRMDVIADLAYPLPVTVIAGMLGVPAEDRDRLKRWSDDAAAFLGGGQATAARFAQAQRSVGEMVAYFRGIVADHRSTPRDDLINALVAAEDRGDVLGEGELLATCILLLAAGHETTTNLIGNGTLALLRNPDQMRRLRDDPSLVVSAVEELLRYDSPVQLVTRLAAEDLEIDGRTVRKGQRVLALLGAANRDSARFPEPDRLDLGRRDNRHVAFGHGIHFCLGAPLARLEGQVSLATVLRRMPRLELAADRLEWHANTTFHGPRSLPVAF